jgi:hypothetical protein
VPGVAADAGAGILERLVLETASWKTDGASVLEESLAVGGDEMRHSLAAPDVAMQPESTIHSVDHSVSASREFEVRRALLGDFCVRLAT